MIDKKGNLHAKKLFKYTGVEISDSASLNSIGNVSLVLKSMYNAE